LAAASVQLLPDIVVGHKKGKLMATQTGQLTEIAGNIQAMSARAENEDIRDQLSGIADDVNRVISCILRWQTLQAVRASIEALASRKAL
jgi:hypothetical protein